MFPEHIWTYCRAHGLLLDGETVIAAVSGGADSVALLMVLCALREKHQLSIVCAHFNHGLRGLDSDTDAAFVADLAGNLGIPLLNGADDVPKYAAEHHASMEEAARELRLRFLRTCAIEQGASHVATGHTRDDQVETVLFHLFKGTGVRGLAGMAPRSGMMVRPLLDCSGQELREWLLAQGRTWREDASNRDTRYERNFIRHDVLPLVESRFGGVRRAVARTASMARDSGELFGRLTEQVTDNVQIVEPGDGSHAGTLRIALPSLKALADPLLQYALEDVFMTAGIGSNFARLSRCTDAIRAGLPGTRVSIDGEYTLEVDHHYVYLYGKSFMSRASDPVDVVSLPAVVEWYRRRLNFEVPGAVEVPADLKQVDWAEAWFDLDGLELPLTVRAWQAGDRMQLFGGRTRKVQDLFVDGKVDRLMRLRRPMVCDRRGIIWVPGLARGQAGPIGPGSSRVLRIVYYSSQC